MPKNLTDVDEFTDPVSVPVDSDPRNANSVEVPYQALANRTRNLDNRLSPIEVNVTDGEWVYENPKSRTVLVPLANYIVNSADDADVDPVTGVAGTTIPIHLRIESNLHVAFPLDLPDGAVITRCRAGVTHDVSHGTASKLELMRQLIDRTGTLEDSDLLTVVDEVSAGTGSGPHILDITGLSETVDNTFHYLYLRFQSGDNAAGTDPDRILWLDVVYDDPGPRNF